MRGADTFTESLFCVRKLDDFVPGSHPLRSIRIMANEALAKMDRLFAGMYEADIKGGRPSIPPEKLLRAMLLQVLYSIRSERQLMEQVQYNLLFRWFIGLAMEFTKNRERLIRHDAVVEFFNEVLSIAQKKNWLSGVGATWVAIFPAPGLRSPVLRGAPTSGIVFYGSVSVDDSLPDHRQ
jgi:transposase